MTDKILEENKRRLARIHRRFDPLSGEGSTGEIGAAQDQKK